MQSSKCPCWASKCIAIVCQNIFLPCLNTSAAAPLCLDPIYPFIVWPHCPTHIFLGQNLISQKSDLMAGIFYFCTSCRGFAHSSYLLELMIRHKLTSPASEKPCSLSKALMKVNSIISAMDISDVPVEIFLMCLLCTSQDIFYLTTNLQQDHRCDNK